MIKNEPLAYLANNENPLGASPLAIQALKEESSHLHLYPDNYYPALKDTIAQFFALAPAQITVGNGSENILELIIKAYLSKQQNAIISEYTFITIPLLIQNYGQLKSVKTKHYEIDLDGMLAAIDEHTRLLFLVNPNNPTGTYVAKNNLISFLNKIPKEVIVVIDEAYSEFITADDFPNAHAYLALFPNLIVTRTFSKGYGLASLRLGYALSSTDISMALNQMRLPFNVNLMAAKAGMAAMMDHEHILQTQAHVARARIQLTDGLKKLGLAYLPSLGNFISVEVGSAAKVTAYLKNQGIFVRSLQDYGLPCHIRVSLGSHAEIDYFLKTMANMP